MTQGDEARPIAPTERAQAATAGGAAAPKAPPKRRVTRGRTGLALMFLTPALVLLGALVLYPILFTIVRSTFDAAGDRFVGAENYRSMFASRSTLTAIKNNAIWVVVAPTVVTALGLIFAVLSERIRWQTAFKFVIFMPMAISFLAAGVIFRLVYEDDPDRGLANAVAAGVIEVFRSPGQYEGARPADPETLRTVDDAFLTSGSYAGGAQVTIPLLAISPSEVPPDSLQARPPESPPTDAISGTVWLDFRRGGGGTRGEIDDGEFGLPGITVEALDGDRVVASARTAADGSFVLEGVPAGQHALRLNESAFRAPFRGVSWLGPTLVTPAIIGSFVWIWAGFAMVVIGAGLAAIPRDVMEAARVDGASEWQVFRRVTVPLLSPVLLVVLVTLMINVLKVFDLVLVIPPRSTQADANVIALEMWRVSFGGARDFGLGSALGVFLFLLVIPAMAFNIRRFKTEG